MMMSLPSGMNGFSASQGYGFGVPRKAAAMPAKPTEQAEDKEAVALQQAATHHRTNATLAGLATVVAVPSSVFGVSELAYRNGLDKKLKYAGPSAESQVDRVDIEKRVTKSLQPHLVVLQQEEQSQIALQKREYIQQAQRLVGATGTQTIDELITSHKATRPADSEGMLKPNSVEYHTNQLAEINSKINEASEVVTTTQKAYDEALSKRIDAILDITDVPNAEQLPESAKGMNKLGQHEFRHNQQISEQLKTQLEHFSNTNSKASAVQQELSKILNHPDNQSHFTQYDEWNNMLYKAGSEGYITPEELKNLWVPDFSDVEGKKRYLMRRDVKNWSLKSFDELIPTFGSSGLNLAPGDETLAEAKQALTQAQEQVSQLGSNKRHQQALLQLAQEVAEGKQTVSIAQADHDNVTGQLETLKQNHDTLKPSMVEHPEYRATVKQAVESHTKQIQRSIDEFPTEVSKGKGKAWNNATLIEEYGFKDLAEHTKGARNLGIAAGATMAVLGTGLTLWQLSESGKAEQASKERQAKLAELRKMDVQA